jgi:hypothetical protein
MIGLIDQSQYQLRTYKHSYISGDFDASYELGAVTKKKELFEAWLDGLKHGKFE